MLKHKCRQCEMDVDNKVRGTLTHYVLSVPYGYMPTRWSETHALCLSSVLTRLKLEYNTYKLYFVSLT